MGCVQSYFRKGSYDVYEAHSAGLSPSSTQGSDKAALTPDDVVANQLEGDELEKDIVIVDADEIKLAEKEDAAESPEANGTAKTAAMVAAGTAAVVGAAGAALAGAAEDNIEGSRAASATEQTDSRPASGKSEGEEQPETVEPVPEVDTSRAESAAKPEETGSRPESASPAEVENKESKAESETEIESRPESIAAESATVTSRPESVAKDDSRSGSSAKDAEVASVGSRAESAAKEEVADVGTRPTSASVSVAEPKDEVPDSRATSVAESEKDVLNLSQGAPSAEPVESATPTPATDQGNPEIQIDDFSEEPPESPSVTESVVPAVIAPESDSSRPQSTTETTIQQAVNPETGTPQDQISRAVSSSESRPASELPQEISDVEQEITHEISVTEPEEAKDASSRPLSASESISAEPSSLPSGSIDVEELGVQDAASTDGQAEDVKASDPDDSESLQNVETKPEAELVPTDDMPVEKEGSRPVSASQSIGAESNATKESSRPASSATLVVGEDASSRPGSSTAEVGKASESRPESRVESAAGSEAVPTPAVESRPESVASKAESGIESASDAPIAIPPAETPVSETEADSRPGSGVVVEGGSPEVASESPSGVATTEEDLPKPPAEDDESVQNSAATTIQATFRGHQTRQALKNQDKEEETVDKEPIAAESTEPDTNLEAAATTIQANYRGYKTRQTLKNENVENDTDATDSEELPPPPIIPETDAELESAATTIQANFRGYQTRQALKNKTDALVEESADAVSDDLPPPPTPPDPNAELESAATTIQANFRGYQTRQALKNRAEEGDAQEIVAGDLPLPPTGPDSDKEMESAATTIQANFRGYQTRQALKKKDEGDDIVSAENAAEDLPPPPSPVADADAELESAATTIQANFRGYQTRQTLKKNAEGEGNEAVISEDFPAPSSPTDQDAELESAATTIQANFRGYQTRKALKNDTTGGTDADASEMGAVTVEAESGVASSSGPEEEELAAAATTIQANFRGYQTRQALKNKTEGETGEAIAIESKDPITTNEETDLQADDEMVSAATTIQANFRGYQTRQALKKETDEIPEPVVVEESTKDDAELAAAATTIQANYRGYQTRQALKKSTEDVRDVDVAESVAGDVQTVESLPGPESDAELEAAATTIQANFRGYQTRQALKKDNDKDTDEAGTVVGDAPVVESSPTPANDAELESAATTIQANFRGYQTRQALKKETNEATDSIAESVAGDVQAIDSLFGPSSEEELTSAATTIQANYRGYQTRKALKEGVEDSVNEVVVHAEPVTVIPAEEEDSELAAAATTIQANFRGHQTRQALKKQKDDTETVEPVSEDLPAAESVPESDPEMVSAATTIQANFRGYQTRQALKKTNEGDAAEETSASAAEDTLAPEVEQAGGEVMADADLESAATTIQANYRGYQTRQALKKQNGDGSPGATEGGPTPQVESNPEMESAATTIQANFRGYQTRQALKKENEDGDQEKKEVEPAPEVESNPEMESAATTIQANFRGYQTRQALKNTGPADVVLTPPSDTMQILAEHSQAPPAEVLELHDALFGSPTAEVESSLTDVTTGETDTTSERDGSLVSEPLAASATPRSPETGEKVKESAEESSELQRNQECDELPSQRGISEASSIDMESSQSSAATKIQAGVRGFIARRQVQQMRNDTSTSTTAPSLPDSQQSFGFSMSQDETGVQPIGSPETEIQKQNISVEENGQDDLTSLLTDASKTLDSGSDTKTPEVKKAKSEPIAVEEEDQQVWQTLQKELEEAATTIQSNYRGYRTRQKLQREDAVQMPTTSSSTVSAESDTMAATKNIPHSGEFHDMIVLPPGTPTIPDLDTTDDQKP